MVLGPVVLLLAPCPCLCPGRFAGFCLTTLAELCLATPVEVCPIQLAGFCPTAFPFAARYAAKRTMTRRRNRYNSAILRRPKITDSIQKHVPSRFSDRLRIQSHTRSPHRHCDLMRLSRVLSRLANHQISWQVEPYPAL